MSESCPLLTLAQLEARSDDIGDLDEEVASALQVRHAVPLVDLRIVDDDMERRCRTTASATGEIVVRAPWLTQGYLTNPGARPSSCGPAATCTRGDIGNIDANGYLQITDRLKDVIKTGGEWVSSLELEDLISQHPGVARPR